MNEPPVSIIVLNWNRKELTLRLLTQLQRLDYPEFSMLLVDNASTDGSAEAVKAAFPAVKICRNPENLGTTGGFNSGMQWVLEHEPVKYLWLLDNDLEVEKDSLRELVNALEAAPEAAIAGPMVLNADFKELVMEAGARIDWQGATSAPVGKGEKKEKLANRGTIPVDYLPGGCGTLIRIEALKKIGLMDETYFFLWEDIDFGFRFKKAGFKVIAVPGARVYHKDITLVRGSPRHRYYSTRNNLRFFFSHSRGLHSRFNSLVRAITAGLLYHFWGFPAFSRAAFKGLRDFVFNKKGKQEYDFGAESAFAGFESLKLAGKKLLFFPASAKDLELLKQLPEPQSLDIAVEDYLQNQFLPHNFKLISFKSFDLKSLGKLAGNLFKEKYDFILTCRETFSPLLGFLNARYPVVMLKQDRLLWKAADSLIFIKYFFVFSAARLLAVLGFFPLLFSRRN